MLRGDGRKIIKVYFLHQIVMFLREQKCCVQDTNSAVRHAQESWTWAEMLQVGAHCCLAGQHAQGEVYLLCVQTQRCSEAVCCNTGSTAQHTSDSLHAWFWINFWLLCFGKPFTAAKVFSTSTVNYVVTHSLRSWEAGVGCWKNIVLDPKKQHANVALLRMLTGTGGHC